MKILVDVQRGRRRRAASIRKLIEHLRIESKPGPLGMDILDISDGLGLIRDSGRNGWRWVYDDNGCDRLFSDVTCPRFSCNFIRLIAVHA